MIKYNYNTIQDWNFDYNNIKKVMYNGNVVYIKVSKSTPTPPTPQYRTISGTPYCIAYDKYLDVYSQVSYDGGVSWTTTATTPTLVEHNSQDCGYIPPTAYKCRIIYDNWGEEEYYDVPCDGNSVVTSTEVGESPYIMSNSRSVVFGNCITKVGNDAFNRHRITSITFSDTITELGTASFASCEYLPSVSFTNNLITIGGQAFKYNFSLGTIDIPNSVTTIGAQAFFQCTSLTSANIGNGVTFIGGSAFERCSALTSVTINAITPPTLDIADAFDNTNNCPIYVPCQSVDAYKAATNWSYYANRIQGIPPCSSSEGKLTVEVSGSTYQLNCNGNSTLSRDYDVTPFIFTRGLTIEGVKTAIVGECVTELDNNCFNYFSGMTSVSLPSTLTNIGYDAFYDCFSLSSVTIPSSVRTIGIDAFANCYNISAVTVPSGVEVIEVGTFDQCFRLVDITLPSTIREIKRQAFFVADPGAQYRSIAINTVANRKVYIHATTPPTLTDQGDTIFMAEVAGTTATYKIYVPNGSVEAYKAAWTAYADRIYPMNS